MTAAEQFCARRSCLATAAKHGVHFFEALVTLAEGRTWLPRHRLALHQTIVKT